MADERANFWLNFWLDLQHPAGWFQGIVILVVVDLFGRWLLPELFRYGGWLYAVIAVATIAIWFIARAFNLDLWLRYRIWIPRVYPAIRPLLQRLRVIRVQPDTNQLIKDSYRDISKNGILYPTFVRRRDLRRSWWPHRVFQIVLLDNPQQWVIKCHDDSWQLKVDITESHYGVYNNRGKKTLDELFVSHMKKDAKKLPQLKELLAHSQAIHDHLMGDPTAAEKAGDEFLGGMALPLRWASGGVLPIVRHDQRNWVQLFFRDIKPIGWNVGNGASESEAEYRTQLGRLLTREFCEEVLLVSGGPANGLLHHMFEADDAASRDYWSPEFWRRQVARRQEDDNVVIRPSGERRHATEGNGGMAVEVVDRHAWRSTPSRFNNVFFSVNPCELGVEIITLRRFRCGNEEWILDGELHEDGYLVRRPAILLDLEYLREQFRRIPRLGAHIEDDMERLDCKMLDEIPAGVFKIFTQDIALRHARRRRIADLLRSTRSTKMRGVLEGELTFIDKWLYVYEKRFVEAAKSGATVADEHLRSLCPVTWKTLELAFRHGGL